MGKPAARIGDMTAHGGSIILGCPTVLIGGMPAARLADMHVCPMLTPGVPPIPHVGGPIMLGSSGVFIGGMPAARVGDLATCVGPPDVIILGCFTVLIGETMGGAAKPPAPAKIGLSSAAAARLAAATALTDNTEASTNAEHWVEFQFVDKAGKPVSGIPYKFNDPSGKESKGVLRPDGRICRDALNPGECKVQLFSVSNAKWSKDRATVGEKVKLSADTEGFGTGTPALFQIYRRDINRPDFLVTSVDSNVKGDKVEAEWEYVLANEDKKTRSRPNNKEGYSTPEFYFEVLVESLKTRSGLLAFNDWIEIEIEDIDGHPIADEGYVLSLSNGEIRRGKIGKAGEKKEEKIPPGHCHITLFKKKYKLNTHDHHKFIKGT